MEAVVIALLLGLFLGVFGTFLYRKGSKTPQIDTFSTILGQFGADLSVLKDATAAIRQQQAESTGAVGKQLEYISSGTYEVQRDTAKLLAALSNSQVRGAWGQVQLRRVVEVAGMLPHVDFDEQVSVTKPGVTRFPDMVINYPGGTFVPVDAKVPLKNYLEAMNETDEGRRNALLQGHARALRDHVSSLGSKEYHSFFTNSPEFVVLFVPIEALLAAALDLDGTIFDFAASKRVILASPSTLLALLMATSYGWRQQVQTEQVEQIARLGSELYSRLQVVTQAMSDMRAALGTVNEAFNRLNFNLEKRVFVTGRKLQALTGDAKALRKVEDVE
jgi:DNA recombination protein RmuC